MRRRTLVVLAVLALAMASPACAQPPLPPLPVTPTIPGSAGIELVAEDDRAVVSVERQAIVRLTATNTQSPTGTPLDQERVVGVAVSGVPPNWTVAVEPPSFRLAPGGQQAITLRLQVSADAASADAAILVTARLYPAGVTDLPGAGSTVQPEATDSVLVNATRVEPLDRQVLERLDGPWVFVLLLALLASVLVATQVLARNRRRAVALRARTTTGSLSPGGRVSLPLQVQNVSGAQDTILLRVASLPSGWAAFLPIAELPLAPGRSEELDLVVIAPPEAPVGTRQSVLVTATSSQNPRRPASLAFEAVVAPPRRGP